MERNDKIQTVNIFQAFFHSQLLPLSTKTYQLNSFNNIHGHIQRTHKLYMSQVVNEIAKIKNKTKKKDWIEKIILKLDTITRTWYSLVWHFYIQWILSVVTADSCVAVVSCFVASLAKVWNIGFIIMINPRLYFPFAVAVTDSFCLLLLSTGKRNCK